LNSDVNERRGRGFFFPMLSMMDIILLGPKPLISGVRQSGSSPESAAGAAVCRADPSFRCPIDWRNWLPVSLP
jgi:uncharacterized Zn-binding protein involved in type VI secretion